MDFSGLSLADLRVIAKEKGLKGISALKKSELIATLEAVEKEKNLEEKNSVDNHTVSMQERSRTIAVKEETVKNSVVREETAKPFATREESPKDGGHRNQKEGKSFIQSMNPNDMSSLDSGELANGILEVMPDGFGFIRCANYLPGDQDIYVSPAQIKRFNLKTGDILNGNLRIRTEREKFRALLYVNSVNGFPPSDAQRRMNFEDMTPIFPNERI